MNIHFSLAKNIATLLEEVVASRRNNHEISTVLPYDTVKFIHRDILDEYPSGTFKWYKTFQNISFSLPDIVWYAVGKMSFLSSLNIRWSASLIHIFSKCLHALRLSLLFPSMSSKFPSTLPYVFFSTSVRSKLWCNSRSFQYVKLNILLRFFQFTLFSFALLFIVLDLRNTLVISDTRSQISFPVVT